jgi:serine/threonine protein kinase
MTAPSQADTQKDFFAVATRLRLLAADTAETFATDDAASGKSPAQWTAEKGLLDASDIDIIESLLRPADVVPGYELVDVLGRGGMGVVYRARQKNLDRLVALKTVLVSRMSDARDLARFEQEAIAAARLKHPNIVAAYDFGRHAGRVYFVMELVEGESLDQLIARRGRLDEATTWGLVRQAAAGLAHATAAGVVHRDVKPANLLLVAPPEGSPLPPGMPMVKLADLGVALLKGDHQRDTRITMTGATVGSPQYMAPEQLEGSDVDHRADIYALGVSAFRMLVGVTPFDGKTLAQIVAKKLSGRSPRVRDAAPDVSAESDELVAAMMEHDVSRRIADYHGLFDHIDRLAHRPSVPQALQATTEFLVQDSMAVPDTVAIAPSAEFGGVTELPESASNRARSVLWRRAMLVALPAIVVALAVFAWRWFGPRGQAPAGELPMVPSGWGRALYDGSTITVWHALQGVWKHGVDAEGGKVLSGRGAVTRQLPQPDQRGGRSLENYRLSMLVDLQTASAVELHFGIMPAAAAGPAHYVLRVAHDGVRFGRIERDRQALKPISDAVRFPPPDRDAAVNYHELRIERHRDQWLAFFDGKPVGHAPADPAAELPEIRMIAEDGTALFDAVELIELVPATL